MCETNDQTLDQDKDKEEENEVHEDSVGTAFEKGTEEESKTQHCHQKEPGEEQRFDELVWYREAEIVEAISKSDDSEDPQDYRGGDKRRKPLADI